MKFKCLFMVMFVVLLGCSRQSQWSPPFGEGGFYTDDEASIMAFEIKQFPGHSIVFFFPFAGGYHYSHNFNSQTRTFNYSGYVTTSGSKIEKVLTYEVSSTNPSTVICNEKQYSLNAGTVFQVDGSGQISQLPFVGLQPTKEYLNVLKKFLATSQQSASGVTGNLKEQAE